MACSDADQGGSRASSSGPADEGGAGAHANEGGPADGGSAGSAQLAGGGALDASVPTTGSDSSRGADTASSSPLADASCGTFAVGFERVTSSIVLVVTGAASMNDAFGAGASTRWTEVTRSLASLTGLLQHDTRLGLLVVGGPSAAPLGATDAGLDGGDAGACPTVTEVPPALNNSAALQAALTGGPTASPRSTLDEGVKAAAARLAAQSVSGPKYIVLVADSEPVSCVSTDDTTALWNAVREIDYAYQQDGIVTRVVGVSEDISDAHLTMLANAGVRAAIDGPLAVPYYRAVNGTTLDQAFSEIADATAGCVFELGNAIDPNSASTGTVVLDDVALAYGDANGWRLNSSTELEVLGSACKQIHLTAHSITFGFPCVAIK